MRNGGMKAAQLVGMLVVGALSVGTVAQVQAESGLPGLEKIKERWEKRFSDRENLRDKIMSDLKQQDTELEKVQHDLKSATGEKKIDALAAAVNALIDQRMETNKRMLEHLEKASDKSGTESGSALDKSKSTSPDTLPAK